MYFLFWLACSFCLGILLESVISIPFLFLLLLAVILVALSVKNLDNKSSLYFLLISFFVLGAIFLKNYQKLPANHLTKLNIKTTAIKLEGKVISEPKTNLVSAFIFDTKYLILGKTKIKVNGKVLIRCFKEDNFLYGENLILEGKISRIFSATNRGGSAKNFGGNFNSFDYRKFLYKQNIYYILNVKKTSLVKHLDSDSLILKHIFNLRKNLDDLIVKNISYPDNRLLSAILLGKRENIPSGIREVFVQTGTAHILAISGLHVGIVLFIILLLLKVFRIPRKLRFVLAICLLIFYCLLTGARPSVMRATIMGCIFLTALILERELNIYNSLGLSALIILFANPAQLFDVGFELSFICVLAILFLSPKIIIFFEKIKFKKPKFLVRSISISFSAWVSVLPLIAYNFHIITPVTILANLIIVPLSSLITAAGFVFLIIGSLLPNITSIFAISCEFLMQILIISTYWFSRLPGAYFRV